MTLAVLGAVSYYQFFRDESCESRFRQLSERQDPFPPSGNAWAASDLWPAEGQDLRHLEFSLEVSDGESARLTVEVWNPTGERIAWRETENPWFHVVDPIFCDRIWASPTSVHMAFANSLEAGERSSASVEWEGVVYLSNLREADARYGRYFAFAAYCFLGEDRYSCWYSPFYDLVVRPDGITASRQ